RSHGRLGLLGPANAGRARLDAAQLGRGAVRRTRGVHTADGAGAVRFRRRSTREDRGRERLAGVAARVVGAAEDGRTGRRTVAATLREAGRRAAARAAVQATQALVPLVVARDDAAGSQRRIRSYRCFEL